MATRTIGKLLGIGRFIGSQRPSMPRCYSLHMPDYLQTGKSKIPLYVTLNIQIKSYSYPVLESYQSFIDSLAEILDMEVDNSWALPPTCYKIQKFKPNSSAVITEYDIKEYERNIQMTEVSAIQYPILLRALEASLPEGVTLKIEYFNELYEKKRYVPDKELLDLQEELDAMQRK